MIVFSESTRVGKLVPKTVFYMEINARLKTRFVEDVECVKWLYKLAPSTLNADDGKTVHEIVVFRVMLKTMVPGRCVPCHRPPNAASCEYADRGQLLQNLRFKIEMQ